MLRAIPPQNFRRIFFIMQTFMIIAITFILAALGSSCQTVPSTTTDARPAVPVPASTTKAPEPEAPAKDISSIGSLATPTDAYKTAYQLRKNKDVAGLKKVMSNDV